MRKAIANAGFFKESCPSADDGIPSEASCEAERSVEDGAHPAGAGPAAPSAVPASAPDARKAGGTCRPLYVRPDIVGAIGFGGRKR